MARPSLLLIVTALLAMIAGGTGPAAAGGRPGDFDFYVLSLSWSPTFCETSDRRNDMQCNARRPYGFIVHGLWPQYERGYPSECSATVSPSPDVINQTLPIMPSVGLIRHEWRTHGSCSGLSPSAYFQLIQKAFAKVRIPPSLTNLSRHVVVAPQALENAFRAANPTMQSTGISIACRRRKLQEVRICMTKHLDFRPCIEVDQDGCPSTSITLPPIR
ncbi:ribonuclease I [Hartmannibacter diazotrophicus]|uniref:Ribonuclease I n=1 Tax=Hartmannibacter diazotrophicus TaxID=1482074 RepID=A0A2C9D9T5_9HYPH|nr:ribonuclease T2 [Hartmannibacter diazotrophicus]SON57036.1 ribonuclease I [Hartmannibacter diazotrophicus]